METLLGIYATKPLPFFSLNVSSNNFIIIVVVLRYQWSEAGWDVVSHFIFNLRYVWIRMHAWPYVLWRCWLYVDDISLLPLSIDYALSKMCYICLKYAHEYDIQFNQSKCQFIKYGSGIGYPFYNCWYIVLLLASLSLGVSLARHGYVSVVFFSSSLSKIFSSCAVS